MPGMLQIKSFTFGPFETNTYVVSDEQGHVLLIDPACSNEYERQQLLNYLSSFNFHLSILATHGHLDHLWGAKWATERWQTPVLMHEADIPMAKAMQQQYDLFGVRATAEPFPMEPFSFHLSPFTFHLSPFTFHLSPFTLIHTPGHTPGSICLYFPEEKILFSGDTLFRYGYGRTDLPGGNMGQLISSLEHLFTLPPDTQVFPGHGEPTTIAAERR